MRQRLVKRLSETLRSVGHNPVEAIAMPHESGFLPTSESRPPKPLAHDRCARHLFFRPHFLQKPQIVAARKHTHDEAARMLERFLQYMYCAAHSLRERDRRDRKFITLSEGAGTCSMHLAR